MQAVMSGQQDVVVAGGVEVMSRVPLGSARATGMPYGPKVLARYDNFSFNQGLSAELIAKKWGLSRSRLDEYSALSHERPPQPWTAAPSPGRSSRSLATTEPSSTPTRACGAAPPSRSWPPSSRRSSRTE
ncbi:thiolase, N-terminal domain protein [Mycobacterium kansasii]|uniref:Thiolase, N-terminal domain protein n=1 Tax=Mycobacterium kansasii TaxID=1768 RepID=A0A1V3WUY5_MYCKA|nr:thiolase, N-terminal domain protein [Mycobacterium kansasii]